MADRPQISSGEIQRTILRLVSKYERGKVVPAHHVIRHTRELLPGIDLDDGELARLIQEASSAHGLIAVYDPKLVSQELASAASPVSYPVSRRGYP